MGVITEHRTQRVQQLGELERTLATVARLAEGRPEFRDMMFKLEEQFSALARAVRRSAARAEDLDRAYARHSAATVTQAMLEIRAESVLTPSTTVSAGLRRLAAGETPEPLPRGGRVREQVCSDCGYGFDSVLGQRRCPVCTERHDKRRKQDVERARTRPPPTKLSDGWAQVTEEEAKTMRRILRRGDR